MEANHRYAIVALLIVLLGGGFIAAYRAGVENGVASSSPIVITGVSATPPASVEAAPAPAQPVSLPAPPPTATPSVAAASSTEAPATSATAPDTGATAQENPAPTRSDSKKLKAPSDGTVDVNTASADELERLPGVGPKMAERIIAYRTQAGPFHMAEDLMNVGGIGDKKLDKMRPFLKF